MKIKATVYFLTNYEGGRASSVGNSYHANFLFTNKVSADFIIIESDNFFDLGNEYNIIFKAVNSNTTAFFIGELPAFIIREGKRVIGFGKVNAIFK